MYVIMVCYAISYSSHSFTTMRRCMECRDPLYPFQILPEDLRNRVQKPGAERGVEPMAGGRTPILTKALSSGSAHESYLSHAYIHRCILIYRCIHISMEHTHVHMHTCTCSEVEALRVCPRSKTLRRTLCISIISHRS